MGEYVRRPGQDRATEHQGGEQQERGPHRADVRSLLERPNDEVGHHECLYDDEGCGRHGHGSREDDVPASRGGVGEQPAVDVPHGRSATASLSVTAKSAVRILARKTW